MMMMMMINSRLNLIQSRNLLDIHQRLLQSARLFYEHPKSYSDFYDHLLPVLGSK